MGSSLQGDDGDDDNDIIKLVRINSFRDFLFKPVYSNAPPHSLTPQGLFFNIPHISTLHVASNIFSFRLSSPIFINFFFPSCVLHLPTVQFSSVHLVPTSPAGGHCLLQTPIQFRTAHSPPHTRVSPTCTDTVSPLTASHNPEQYISCSNSNHLSNSPIVLNQIAVFV